MNIFRAVVNLDRVSYFTEAGSNDFKKCCTLTDWPCRGFAPTECEQSSREWYRCRRLWATHGRHQTRPLHRYSTGQASRERSSKWEFYSVGIRASTPYDLLFTATHGRHQTMQLHCYRSRKQEVNGSFIRLEFLLRLHPIFFLLLHMVGTRRCNCIEKIRQCKQEAKGSTSWFNYALRLTNTSIYLGLSIQVFRRKLTWIIEDAEMENHCNWATKRLVVCSIFDCQQCTGEASKNKSFIAFWKALTHKRYQKENRVFSAFGNFGMVCQIVLGYTCWQITGMSRGRDVTANEQFL